MRCFLSYLACLTTAAAFSPNGPKTSTKVYQSEASMAAVAATVESGKILSDPMGLYPKDSLERQQGLIATEDVVDKRRVVTDPLSLYSDGSSIAADVEMSVSLPFLTRPVTLDGTMAGDRGFDPLNLASNDEALAFYRTSELKHARLAMLAAVGWPVAELFHNKLANQWGVTSILNDHNLVPSVLNGGLAKVEPVFWGAALAVATVIEICSGALSEDVDSHSGDLGFDPFRLGGKRNTPRNKFMEEAEILNGRLGMLAITGYALQEWVNHKAVVGAILL